MLDTNIVVHLSRLDAASLPDELVISAVTLAELSAGPHHADDPAERARRVTVLQYAEATFDPSHSMRGQLACSGEWQRRS